MRRIIYPCVVVLALVACRPGQPSEPAAPADRPADLGATESSVENAPTLEEQIGPANEYGIPRFLEQLMIEDAVASLAADQESELRLTARSLTYVGRGKWGNINLTFYSAEGQETAGPSAAELWPREDLVKVGGVTYDVGKGLQPWAETVVCYFVTLTVSGRPSPTYRPGIAYGQELEAGRRWKWRYDSSGRFWERNSCPGTYPIEETD